MVHCFSANLLHLYNNILSHTVSIGPYKETRKIMTTNKTEQQAVRTVGYIGLGNAGLSMASNIPKRGYKLVVHDVDQTKAERAAEEWENTVASGGRPDAFEDCEVIVTMLPHGKIVRDVLLGEDGIAKALRPGL